MAPLLFCKRQRKRQFSCVTVLSSLFALWLSNGGDRAEVAERDAGARGLRFVSQESPNLIVLAAQPLFTILSTLVSVAVGASTSDNRGYGFLLSLEESAR
jgi:hypothetical protein